MLKRIPSETNNHIFPIVYYFLKTVHSSHSSRIVLLGSCYSSLWKEGCLSWCIDKLNQDDFSSMSFLALLRPFPVSPCNSYSWTQCPGHFSGLGIRCLMKEMICLLVSSVPFLKLESKSLKVRKGQRCVFFLTALSPESYLFPLKIYQLITDRIKNINTISKIPSSLYILYPSLISPDT